MNSDGIIIPLVEEDQGEGIKDFLDVFDIPIHERFTNTEFFKELEKLEFRKCEDVRKEKEIATSGNHR